MKILVRQLRCEFHTLLKTNLCSHLRPHSSLEKTMKAWPHVRLFVSVIIFGNNFSDSLTVFLNLSYRIIFWLTRLTQLNSKNIKNYKRIVYLFSSFLKFLNNYNMSCFPLFVQVYSNLRNLFVLISNKALYSYGVMVSTLDSHWSAPPPSPLTPP